MISIKNLLDMIYTEAATGEDLSCRDYIRNPEDLPRDVPSIEHPKKYNENLPPIYYPTELIKNKDGTYQWVDNYPIDHLRNPDGSIKL